MPIEITFDICPHCDSEEVKQLTWWVSKDGSFRQLWSCSKVMQ